MSRAARVDVLGGLVASRCGTTSCNYFGNLSELLLTARSNAVITNVATRNGRPPGVSRASSLNHSP